MKGSIGVRVVLFLAALTMAAASQSTAQGVALVVGNSNANTHVVRSRPTAASSIVARDYAASAARQHGDVREEQIAGSADDDEVEQEHDAPSEIMANNLAFIADELRR
jgi:hypothetical protein